MSTEPMKQSYERDGYLFPVPVMEPSQAGNYRAAFEALEDTFSGDAVASRFLFSAPSITCRFVDEIMRRPSILEPVRMILGDDLLVTGTNFFVKEPATSAFVSWHQDLTYWGYDDASEVTAWVALSAATKPSGCMRFIPGSHRRKIVEHHDTFDESNMLSRGQTLAADIDESSAVDAVLLPGEMSLHHGHLFHASHPNESPDRRIGLAIRYVSPSMQQVSGRKTYAQLVSGEDRFGHFELLEPPSGDMLPNDLDNAHRAIARQEEVGYDGVTDRGKRTSM